MDRRTDLAALGECMAELSGPEGARRLGFGGDTLNTALLAGRLLGPWRVAYLTRLGDDPYSGAMRAAWEAEGLDCTLVETVPGETVGLYAIETDAEGERTFTYWRDRAPARGLMTEGDWQAREAALSRARAIYISGITLAILPEAGRARLIDALGSARAAGAMVVVDPNHRPRLWSAAEAARWIARAYAAATLVLSSAPEEAALFGAGDPLERLAGFGVAQAVLTAGGAPLSALDQDTRFERSPLPCPEPVDTTGAGDAFNAGVLAGLIAGGGFESAIDRGLALSALSIGQRGAIPPVNTMAAMMRPGG